MGKTITVVFDGQVLRPDTPEELIDLEPNTRCTITIESTSAPETTKTGEDAWNLLESLAGSIEAPPDWSREHDHYLYGTPKRSSSREGKIQWQVNGFSWTLSSFKPSSTGMTSIIEKRMSSFRALNTHPRFG